MIRFRFREDEDRYYALLAELQEHPLRTSAKISEMLMLEGMRQGVALLAIATLVRDHGGPDFTSLKAYQLSAMIYGSADTPLRTVEKSFLERYEIESTEGERDLLDNSPMRFAPETRHQANGADLDPVLDPGWVDFTLSGDTSDPRSTPTAADRSTAPSAAPKPLRTLHGRPVYREEDFADDQPVHSPAAVDAIRDIIMQSPREWSSWHAMVQDLQSRSHFALAYIDIVLNTPIGRTMLTQCGVFLSPGEALDTTQDEPEG
jgi:hypothetical protein